MTTSSLEQIVGPLLILQTSTKLPYRSRGYSRSDAAAELWPHILVINKKVGAAAV
jgi:hypothetical protein